MLRSLQPRLNRSRNILLCEKDRLNADTSSGEILLLFVLLVYFGEFRLFSNISAAGLNVTGIILPAHSGSALISDRH